MKKKATGLLILLTIVVNIGIGDVAEANSKPDIDSINIVKPVYEIR